MDSPSRPLCSLTTFRSFDLTKNRNPFKMQDVSRITPALRTQELSNTEFLEKVFQNELRILRTSNNSRINLNLIIHSLWTHIFGEPATCPTLFPSASATTVNKAKTPASKRRQVTNNKITHTSYSQLEGDECCKQEKGASGWPGKAEAGFNLNLELSVSLFIKGIVEKRLQEAKTQIRSADIWKNEVQ